MNKYRGIIKNYKVKYPNFLVSKSRTIRVYIPSFYNFKDNERIRVLFMLDGQNLFSEETSFAHKQWHIIDTIEEAYFKYKISPRIVVGLDNSRDRISEYLPKFSSYAIGHYAYKADMTFDFLIKYVFPFIESKLDIDLNECSLSFGGSSMGGLMGLGASIFYKDYFDEIYAFSPAFPLYKYGEEEIPEGEGGTRNDEALNRVIRELSKEEYINSCKIALSSGGQGEEYYVYRDSKKFYDSLISKGWKKSNLKLYADLNLYHDEDQWALYFKKAYLDFYKSN